MQTIKTPTEFGISGWDAILGERTHYPTLTKKHDADYLIIGAGFAGLSALKRLQQLQKDAKIILLEAGAIGQGTASRNSGFMIDLPHKLSASNYLDNLNRDQAQIKLNRRAIAFAKTIAKNFQMPKEALQSCGKINVAHSEKTHQYNLAYAKQLDLLAEPYELLDKQALKARIGIDYYCSGLLTPSTVLLQPALYIRHLSQALNQIKKTQIFEHSAVISLEKKGKRWCAKSKQGQVSANKVLLAVNGLVESFGFYQKRLIHLFTYAAMTRVLSTKESQTLGGQNQWALTSANAMGTSIRYFNTNAGQRLLLRNHFSYQPNLTIKKNKLTNIKKKQQFILKTRFPMLKNVALEYHWAGRLCLSRNNVLAIDELDTNLFSACCQNGLGTVNGTLSGIIAAEKMTASKQTLVPEYKKQAPLKKMPNRIITQLAVNAYLGHQQWQAKNE